MPAMTPLPQVKFKLPNPAYMHLIWSCWEQPRWGSKHCVGNFYVNIVECILLGRSLEPPDWLPYLVFFSFHPLTPVMSERLRMQPLEINVAKLVFIMEVPKHNTVFCVVASTNLWVKLLPTVWQVGMHLGMAPTHDWHGRQWNTKTDPMCYVVKLHSLVKRIPSST